LAYDYVKAIRLARQEKVDTHGLTPALEAENYYVLSEGFRTLRLPRKERFHLRAYARSPQRIFDSIRSYYIDITKPPDFEWDDFKNVQNREKHGVSFYEAQYAFADPQRVIVEDLDHGGGGRSFFLPR